MYFLRDQKVPKNLVATKISLRKKLNSLKKNAKRSIFPKLIIVFFCEILMSLIEKREKQEKLKLENSVLVKFRKFYRN